MAYTTESSAWNQETSCDETMQVVYREWAKYYSKREIMDKAEAYYEKSMIGNRNDTGCLNSRSRAFLYIAKPENSLKYSTTALGLKPLDGPINLQYSNALFYMNDFEKCAMTLHNNSRNFNGGKLKPFMDQLSVVESTMDQSLSEKLFPFAIANRATLYKVGKMIQAEGSKDNVSRWKRLRDEGKCDVQSLDVKAEELLHPREHERRKLTYKIAHQKYIGRNWTDLVFLSMLRHDKVLLLQQTPVSTKQLRTQVEDKFEQVTKFAKMLQSRDPLYNLMLKNGPNKTIQAEIRQQHLYRVQTQTRRDMFNILDKIKQLRMSKKITKLRTYIEDVMRSYTLIKTKRVMPWKFEFLSEVYNVIALAYTDQLTVPDNIMNLQLDARVYKLLKIDPLKDKETKVYVFGDKSTYRPPDAVDYEYIAYKTRVAQLENWLKFVKYPIEKAFIYNSISQYHLQHTKLEDCVQVAIKGRDMARNASSDIWTLLNILQIIRARTLQNKYDALPLLYNQALAINRNQNSYSEIREVLRLANKFTIQMKLDLIRKKNATLNNINKIKKK